MRRFQALEALGDGPEDALDERRAERADAREELHARDESKRPPGRDPRAIDRGVPRRRRRVERRVGLAGEIVGERDARLVRERRLRELPKRLSRRRISRPVLDPRVRILRVVLARVVALRVRGTRRGPIRVRVRGWWFFPAAVFIAGCSLRRVFVFPRPPLLPRRLPRRRPRERLAPPVGARPPRERVDRVLGAARLEHEPDRPLAPARERANRRPERRDRLGGEPRAERLRLARERVVRGVLVDARLDADARRDLRSQDALNLVSRVVARVFRGPVERRAFRARVRTTMVGFGLARLLPLRREPRQLRQRVFYARSFTFLHRSFTVGPLRAGYSVEREGLVPAGLLLFPRGFVAFVEPFVEPFVEAFVEPFVAAYGAPPRREHLRPEPRERVADVAPVRRERRRDGLGVHAEVARTVREERVDRLDARREARRRRDDRGGVARPRGRLLRAVAVRLFARRRRPLHRAVDDGAEGAVERVRERAGRAQGLVPRERLLLARDVEPRAHVEDLARERHRVLLREPVLGVKHVVHALELQHLRVPRLRAHRALLPLRPFRVLLVQHRDAVPHPVVPVRVRA